jgi:hypothetical protein
MQTGSFFKIKLGRIIIACGVLHVSSFLASAAETMYVASEMAHERLCPNTTCPSTNRVYRGQVVEVFERVSGWARVSKYYDSAAEKAEFPSIRSATVARWIKQELLSNKPPAPIAQPKLDNALMDARIVGLPRVGDHGLAEKDVVLLRKYALKLLNSGICKKIEYGDKSTSKAGAYFVKCEGESQNRFFSAADVD